MAHLSEEVAPPINREALIMRIAAYLRINELTDPLIARLLLEEAQIALIQAGTAIEYWRSMLDECINKNN